MSEAVLGKPRYEQSARDWQPRQLPQPTTDIQLPDRPGSIAVMQCSTAMCSLAPSIQGLAGLKLTRLRSFKLILSVIQYSELRSR